MIPDAITSTRLQVVVDWTSTVNRCTESIHHPVQELIADWHVDKSPNALHTVTFHEGATIAEKEKHQ
jgi:hypothetical protein